MAVVATGLNNSAAMTISQIELLQLMRILVSKMTSMDFEVTIVSATIVDRRPGDKSF